MVQALVQSGSINSPLNLSGVQAVQSVWAHIYFGRVPCCGMLRGQSTPVPATRNSTHGQPGPVGHVF